MADKHCSKCDGKVTICLAKTPAHGGKSQIRCWHNLVMSSSVIAAAPVYLQDERPREVESVAGRFCGAWIITFAALICHNRQEKKKKKKRNSGGRWDCSFLSGGWAPGIGTRPRQSLEGQHIGLLVGPVTDELIKAEGYGGGGEKRGVSHRSICLFCIDSIFAHFTGLSNRRLSAGDNLKEKGGNKIVPISNSDTKDHRKKKKKKAGDFLRARLSTLVRGSF